MGYKQKYNELIKENKLPFIIDIVKDKLSYAYNLIYEADIAKKIIEIMDICTETKK